MRSSRAPQLETGALAGEGERRAANLRPARPVAVLSEWFDVPWLTGHSHHPFPSQLYYVRCMVITERGCALPKQVDHRERRETIARALWRVVDQRGVLRLSLREV